MQLVELQQKLKSLPFRVSPVIKVRTLIEREWDIVSWNGDVLEDPHEAGGTEA